MTSEMKVALIYGSNREKRFCDTVAGWAIAEIAAAGDISLDAIDPVTLNLPHRHERRHDAVVAFRRRIDDADAFIVVTPEYNHGYPAALKYLIDSASGEWQAKPVAFISYGGISGGLRAVEQLRLVFAELHAVAIRDSVSFANAWNKFDADGRLLEPDGPRQALIILLARLRWWATALHNARMAAPYDKAVA
jgi:NAD(P)H-dependent FMN reductase